MSSAASGELAQVGANIHTDDEYAKSQGLPGVIADGMIMANWCSSMLVERFGARSRCAAQRPSHVRATRVAKARRKRAFSAWCGTT